MQSRTEIFVKNLSASDSNGQYLVTMLTHGAVPRWPAMIFAESVDDSLMAQLKEADHGIVVYKIPSLCADDTWVNRLDDAVPRMFRPDLPRLVVCFGIATHRIASHYDTLGAQPLWIIADDSGRDLLVEWPAVRSALRNADHVVYSSATMRDELSTTSGAWRDAGSKPRVACVVPRGAVDPDNVEDIALNAIQSDLNLVCDMVPLMCRSRKPLASLEKAGTNGGGGGTTAPLSGSLNLHNNAAGNNHSGENRSGDGSLLLHSNNGLDSSGGGGMRSGGNGMSSSALEYNLNAVEIPLTDMTILMALLRQSANLRRDLYDSVSRETTIRTLRLLILAITEPVLLVDLDNTVVDFTGAFDREFIMTHGVSAIVDTTAYHLPDRIAPSSVPDQPHLAPDSPAAVQWREGQVNFIVSRPGFFRFLQPLPGALNALEQLAGLGFKITFCSTPFFVSPDSAKEKAAWVHQNFPRDRWNFSLILTGQKNLVQGDILVDDLVQLGRNNRHPMDDKSSTTHVIMPFPHPHPAGAAPATFSAPPTTTTTTTTPGGKLQLPYSSADSRPYPFCRQQVQSDTRPTWRQVLFTQPYNRSVPSMPRISRWDDPSSVETIIDALFVKLPPFEGKSIARGGVKVDSRY